MGFSVGSRGKKAFKKLYNEIRKYKVKKYATDKWKIYKKILPKTKHIIGKAYTFTIESLNANVRHYLARFRRKTRCYSKMPYMVELSLFLLFFKKVITCLYV